MQTKSFCGVVRTLLAKSEARLGSNAFLSTAKKALSLFLLATTVSGRLLVDLTMFAIGLLGVASKTKSFGAL
jgi:hypothetical protein